jgi:hypothetical protein
MAGTLTTHALLGAGVEVSIDQFEQMRFGVGVAASQSEQQTRDFAGRSHQ